MTDEEIMKTSIEVRVLYKKTHGPMKERKYVEDYGWSPEEAEKFVRESLERFDEDDRYWSVTLLDTTNQKTKTIHSPLFKKHEPEKRKESLQKVFEATAKAINQHVGSD